MKNRIVLIVAALIFLLALGGLIPYWLFTPVIERKPFVAVPISAPLEQSLVNNNRANQSGPFMPAQPIQYASPFPGSMPDVLMDMNTVTVYGQLDWVVAYELKDFLKSYEQAAVPNSELSEVVERVTQKNNYHLPIVIPPGNLPPVIYDPQNTTQQSPR